LACAGRRTGPVTPTPKEQAEAQEAFERATTELGAGRYNDAVPFLYDVIDKDPTHTVARYNLGVALQRLRQWKESSEVLTAKRGRGAATRTLSKAVQVPQDADADYVHALGTAFQELRRYDEAILCFDAAIDLDAGHLKSRYARALTLQLRGDLEAARKAWRDYIGRDPHSSWGESAREHLATVEAKLAPEAP
jgi:tetratricopeptide (TPR) repeat protein